MNISFSHGIYQCSDNFLQIINNEIVLVNEPVQFQCTFRHGQNVYFYKCTKDMEIQDISTLEDGVLYFIFLLLDLKTSEPYFNILENDFILGDSFPQDGVLFFNTKYNIMYKKVNNSWSEVICLKLGTYLNGNITKQTVGSQINENFTTGDYVKSGQILKDYAGPITKNILCYTLNSNFLTSIDNIDDLKDYPKHINKNYKVYTFKAAEYLPQYSAVKFNTFGELVLCSSDNYNEQALFVTIEDASSGNMCKVIKNGVIYDTILEFEFDSVKPIYLGVNGDLTLTPNFTRNSIQKLGKLINYNTILIDIDKNIRI